MAPAPRAVPTHQLHSVRLQHFPVLLGAVRRILAESSPMYALTEDAVPDQHYAAASAHSADMRLPLIMDGLRVAVRCATGDGAISEGALASLSAADAPSLSTVTRTDPYAAPFTVNGVQVVGIYSVLPPTPPRETQAPLAALRTWFAATLRRIVWIAPMAQFGLLVPFRVLHWFNALMKAVELSKHSALHDSNYHDLQTMCVAKQLQGCGVGGAIMTLVRQEVLESKGGIPGLQGLCQSERTRAFYAKEGFDTEEVYAYCKNAAGDVRKHWLVTLSAAQCATLHARGAP